MKRRRIAENMDKVERNMSPIGGTLLASAAPEADDRSCKHNDDRDIEYRLVMTY